MADDPNTPGTDKDPGDLGRKVGRRAERKRQARARGRRTAWFGLGMFGLVGWSVAVPTLIGIAIGVWADRRWPGEVSWTLTLLIIGVALGCLNAWYWIKQESEDD
ncbi:AtpZ/AtpI family protein [Marinobacter pelagius]|uniref:ATP synthase protein I n=1 Tax=Marinobacter pelagius TaxID=379482 RepID=A0A1I4W7N5_9GAMM|nr:AtpZ/AtpI family protein [Marinobacter pelagius]SFN09455.1 ATP synthase protein I [Marinobacter pelagius]